MLGMLVIGDLESLVNFLVIEAEHAGLWDDYFGEM
jgi:hypothetical protein